MCWKVFPGVAGRSDVVSNAAENRAKHPVGRAFERLRVRMSKIIESERLPLNGHAVGIVLKELVRRAIKVIRAEREAFEVMQKAGYGGDMTDVFTTADSKAQKIYVRSLEECFPSYGIIAEEGSLSQTQVDGRSYFTVDPLDGTKAFIRRQSHGVGTMVAMVEDGQVASAYVGDVNTQEIYGFRPGSTNVHRITEFETAERLDHVKGPLSGQNILLRDPPACLFGNVSTPASILQIL